MKYVFKTRMQSGYIGKTFICETIFTHKGEKLCAKIANHFYNRQKISKGVRKQLIKTLNEEIANYKQSDKKNIEIWKYNKLVEKS